MRPLTVSQHPHLLQLVGEEGEVAGAEAGEGVQVLQKGHRMARVAE